jgi:hypothetical protein
MFVLPTRARSGGIFGYRNIKLLTGQPPVINDAWWRRAVMAGGNCKLVTTSGLIARAANPKLHPEVIRAHGGHRLVGATISIEF